VVLLTLASELACNRSGKLADKIEAWFNALPEGTVKDHARQGKVYALFRSNPATAMSISERITDTTTRHCIQRRVLRTWLRSDRKKAQAYITESDLPADIKDDLLR